LKEVIMNIFFPRIVLLFSLIGGLTSSAYALDPTASCTASNVTTPDATTYTFLVTYSDDGPIVENSIDSNDVRVTGPSGYSAAGQVVSIEVLGNGSPVRVVYSIVPPGGSWDSADNGTYSVVMQPQQVFDMLGNAVAPGTLRTFTVNVTGGTPPQTAQPLNISTRGRVQTGDNVMIGGFIISGSTPKQVLIRALGPTLQQFGVGDALPDPTLELFGANGPILANNNWKETQQAEIQATGLAPSNDAEAAMIVTLNPGNYTAIVRGANGGTGIGLVEAYDRDSAVPAKLANISTRALVLAGDGVMIGGFILGNGSGAARVVIRAIGPSLGQFGVAGALQDPTLELRSASGVLVQSNDNWKDSQQAAIEATGLGPANDSEAAIVATLPQAAYTAIVAGKNGTTGVALVEVYQVP
jgi:hypothetical protein